MLFPTKLIPFRALSQGSRRVTYPIARRRYATDYEKRTQETLKTSSRLTWLTGVTAIGAAGWYYMTSDSSTTPGLPTTNPQHTSDATKPGHRHEAAYASDVPKPVEDRHGDTVTKHSIAAHKNETKVRTGVFSHEKFDNDVEKHTPGNPGGDFEKKK